VPTPTPLQGNAESQAAAKAALVPMLVLVQIPKVVEGPRDVDDLQQLAVAAADALSACVDGNAELQVGRGGSAWRRYRGPPPPTSLGPAVPLISLSWASHRSNTPGTKPALLLAQRCPCGPAHRLARTCPRPQADLHTMGMPAMMVEVVVDGGASEGLRLAATRALGLLAERNPKVQGELNSNAAVVAGVLAQLQVGRWPAAVGRWTTG
jgi:hypothetical protein